MKIAFFSTLTNSPWGGSEVLWTKTASELKAGGHTVEAYVKEWPVLDKKISGLADEGINIQFHTNKDGPQSTASKAFRKLQSALITAPSAFEKMLASKPEFIFFSQGHSYDLGYYKDEELRQLFNSEIPFTLICQNNTDYSYVPEADVRKRISDVYKRAVKIFFVSERNRQTAEKIICDTIPNAAVISNSTSLANLKDEPLPYPENETAQFASVARLRCSHKGQNILFDVLSAPVWRDRKWVLNLYGSGEDEQYLRDLAVFYGIGNSVILHGQTSAVADIWKTNQIMLLASFGEGMPLAVQEAMLCARAAIVTDVGGNAELIKEGHTGWLADGTTFSSFSAALERAWHAREQWQQLGLNAFTKINALIDKTPEKTLAGFALAEAQCRKM